LATGGVVKDGINIFVKTPKKRRRKRAKKPMDDYFFYFINDQ